MAQLAVTAACGALEQFCPDWRLEPQHSNNLCRSHTGWIGGVPQPLTQQKQQLGMLWIDLAECREQCSGMCHMLNLFEHRQNEWNGLLGLWTNAAAQLRQHHLRRKVGFGLEAANQEWKRWLERWR
jgi:hypothetical protein